MAEKTTQDPQDPNPQGGQPAADPNPNPDPAAGVDPQLLAGVRAQVEQAFLARLKEAAGVDSLEALAEQRRRAEEERLKQQGEFEKLAEQRAADAAQWRERYERQAVHAALVARQKLAE